MLSEAQTKFLPMRSWVLIFALMMGGVGHGADEITQSTMKERYAEFKQTQSLKTNQLPFQLNSTIEKDYSFASIRYFLKGISLAQFNQFLGQYEQWCHFIPLHLNIKACTYLEKKDQKYLRFYAGAKGYVSPEKAHILQLSFNTNLKDGVFSVRLFAADGPFDSANIDFNIRAIEVGESNDRGLYLEFDLSSVPGLVANLAKIYLITVGRNKVGFSRDGKTWSGKPKLVDGTRGATERNIVRYLLSIEAYLATVNVPEDERFERRLEHWFDATELYKKQLHELSRNEYIAIKKRERKNQMLLQQGIISNIQPDFKKLDRGN